MNSHTATVTTPLAWLVAEWVPAAVREDLIRGAHTARVMSLIAPSTDTPSGDLKNNGTINDRLMKHPDGPPGGALPR